MLSSNLQSFCLTLLGAGVLGMYHNAQLKDFDALGNGQDTVFKELLSLNGSVDSDQ
jgi:hypothetical protein